MKINIWIILELLFIGVTLYIAVDGILHPEMPVQPDAQIRPLVWASYTTLIACWIGINFFFGWMAHSHHQNGKHND